MIYSLSSSIYVFMPKMFLIKIMNFSHWVMNEPALNRAVCHSLNWSLIEWSNAGTFHSVSFPNQIQFGLVWNLRLTNFNFFQTKLALVWKIPRILYRTRIRSLVTLVTITHWFNWQYDNSILRSMLKTLWWQFGGDLEAEVWS